MADADKTRDRRYKERQRERGFSQVLVWVPTADVPAVKEYANQLRQKLSPPSGNTGGIPPHPKPSFSKDDQ